jgi:hypothetical protein
MARMIELSDKLIQMQKSAYMDGKKHTLKSLLTAIELMPEMNKATMVGLLKELIRECK